MKDTISPSILVMLPIRFLRGWWKVKKHSYTRLNTRMDISYTLGKPSKKTKLNAMSIFLTMEINAMFF